MNVFMICSFRVNVFNMFIFSIADSNAASKPMTSLDKSLLCLFYCCGTKVGKSVDLYSLSLMHLYVLCNTKSNISVTNKGITAETKHQCKMRIFYIFVCMQK